MLGLEPRLTWNQSLLFSRLISILRGANDGMTFEAGQASELLVEIKAVVLSCRHLLHTTRLPAPNSLAKPT
jgi:hypothetical protein